MGVNLVLIGSNCCDNLFTCFVKHLLNQIKETIVCVKCSDEFMTGSTDAKSLQDYSKIDAGFTERGLQLWCQRHQVNILREKN